MSGKTPSQSGGNPGLSLALAKQAVESVQTVHDEGYSLQGRPSAVFEAARRLKINPSTLRGRVRTAAIEHDLHVVARPQAPLEPVGSGEAPPEQGDPVLIRRLRDDTGRLRRELDDAHRELDQAREFRSSLLGLVAEPVSPIKVSIPAKRVGKSYAEAALLDLSDIHYNEVISLEQTSGLNKYNSEIAKARIIRCFLAAIDLVTKHWTGPPPSRFIILLAGDLFSGTIHEELADTNDGKLPVSVKDLLAILVYCVNLLLARVSCPVEIISVPGNHSRTSKKPRIKNYAATNYDSLVADLLEWHFDTIVKEKRIRFYRPEGVDAVFKVFDWTFLGVHGDVIGSGGGQGFIGPAATVARGMKKIVDEYAASKIFIDYILMHHFHTTLRLEYGYVNGCICGPNEFSTKKLRARPKAATQNFFAIHPERGITQHREIQVGAPEEGSLYRRVA